MSSWLPGNGKKGYQSFEPGNTNHFFANIHRFNYFTAFTKSNSDTVQYDTDRSWSSSHADGLVTVSRQHELLLKFMIVSKFVDC